MPNFGLGTRQTLKIFELREIHLKGAFLSFGTVPTVTAGAFIIFPVTYPS
jgi:hypothetical protein